jgi:benzoyl-CoA reductase/2-hydroxyglutaryl-CoA dehydratase subunit BcrC/BadD/HgdB
MDALERLDAHLKGRITALQESKRQGYRIVGYAAGGYMPEELVIACNAIPLCFIQAGDDGILNEAGKYICRWMDPFWRSQVGYITSGADPYYTIADLVVIPITDNHARLFSNTVSYYTPEIASFLFGVPHTKDASALSYYLQGISRLRRKLEGFTGVAMTEAKLKAAMELCNRERKLFEEISLMRRSKNPTFTSREFTALHHGSFLADKEVMIEILKTFMEEVKNRDPFPEKGPRILFTGSTLARGDSKIPEMIEAAGGVVVTEEFAEGMRPYLMQSKTQGDLMANLAETYFMERTCPGWFRPGTERLDFLVKLSRDYNIDGLIWYQLMYRESYKMESHFFPERIEQATGLKTLILESEYDAMETGIMQPRIETFMQMIRR